MPSLSLTSLPMFAINSPGQRSNSNSQSSAHSHPYTHHDLYNPQLESHIPLETTPRPLATGDTTIHNMYAHPGDNSYDNIAPNTGNINYSKGSLSSETPFSQSYDRHPVAATSSDLRVTSDIYHNHHYAESPRSHYSNLERTRGGAISNVLDTFTVSAHPSFAPEPDSAVTGPSSEHSGDSDFWPVNTSSVLQPDPLKPKKGRREKPRIELAPDQPPTTQGKPRARVYVACLQCRTRKIRCDGAKPICHNCGRRATGGNDCNYDPVPKRRGPDKTPGARQRMARDVRNEVESAPRRRRRNRGNTTLVPKSTSQPPPPPLPPMTLRQPNISDSPQYHSRSPDNRISLEISPGLADNTPPITEGGTPIPNYSRSSYSPCPCHGAVQCPSLLSIGTGLPESRKPVSIITNYHDDYNLVSIISPYSGNNQSYIAELDENGNERENGRPSIASEPSLNFSRKIWWDSLLSLYLSPTSTRLQALTLSQRQSAMQSITSDLRFIFRASNYWFSFFHIPTFFHNYFDSAKRDRIQPSLVLALLALSTFWQSSEIGYGNDGRERALRFRDEAQAAMDASFNAGWVDETLAQTAWLLALFEVCAHPRHSSERSTSSMLMLDSIIRSLSLTLVDADDPNTSMFSPGTVPVVNPRKPGDPGSVWLPSPATSTSPEDAYNVPPVQQPTHPEKGCSCHRFTLGEHWPPFQDHAPLWNATPAWDESWTEAETRKESCRRLCWSAMILAAGHISYTTAHRSQSLDLFIADPANYALLFSGESVARSPTLSKHSSKDTMWALHDRSFLLWHGCIRMRNNVHATDTEKAQFAVKAWLEADSLEQTLNLHTCSIERAFIFQAREYIFNTRMCISYEFRRYVPLVTANVNGLFHRNKAEEWLTHQAIVAERFMHGLHTVTGNSSHLLARRPFFVFWFMGQIHRALALYECDSTLTVALDVCKALIPAIDYLTTLWPCNEQRYRYKSLRHKVEDCCFNAGIEPPPKFDLSSPIKASPDHLI